MRRNFRAFALFSSFLLGVGGAEGLQQLKRTCKIIPTDPQWPSIAVWNEFNNTVDGRLILTVPLATPCHEAEFNEEQCAIVQANWHDADFHEQSSGDIQAAAFANRSCDPFNGPDSPCIIGNYVEYAVNVSAQEHVLAVLNFVTTHNIRFVVKNTGHDYMGKSTGHGGLSIWTHYLTETQWFLDFKDPFSTYRGPAVVAQAGVSVLQIYSEASQHGLSVVGGACPTVGYTGGFLQGGGHGPLSTLFGLAADDVLSLEVITTTGNIITASPIQNADLFFALTGGGPGTYGIVWSATVKAHPDIPTVAVTLIFSVGNTVSLDTWFEAVNTYRRFEPSITEKGGYALAVYELGFFQLQPLLLPNSSGNDAQELLAPFMESLNALNVPFQVNITSYSGFLDAYTDSSNATLYDIANAQIGGRLFLNSFWKSNSSLSAIDGVFKELLSSGVGVYDIAVAPKSPPIDKLNQTAINPLWRETQSTVSIFIEWDDHGNFTEAHAQQLMITDNFMLAVKRVTPESGAYMNEADAFDPDWMQTFYGNNYDQLLSIKDKYDPSQLLYGSTAVGGNRWVTLSDGRLCPIGQ